MHVLLLSGSTRSGATTTAVLRTAAALAPSGVTTAFAPSPADLPAFDPDLDRDPLPPAVAGLRRAAGAADAVLCCAPEYAGTLPGSFTNVLDWLVGGGELLGKRAAWINAASVAAPTGGAGATAALATVLGYLGAEVVPAACLRLPVPRQAVGPDRLVTDPSLRDRIAAAIPALVAPAAPPATAGAVRVDVVGPGDLPDLLPLLRAYCDFYEVAPSDAQLERLCRALIADPVHEGRQFLARRDGGAVGFATCYWTWETTGADRVAVMNDLYVAEAVRGAGVGRALLAACRDAARDHGAARLVWQTAPDNHRAQRLYDRTGAARSTWLTYELPVDAAGQAAVAR